MPANEPFLTITAGVLELTKIDELQHVLGRSNSVRHIDNLPKQREALS